MSEVYKIQVNDSEPIEVSQQVYEVSFCFNEMLKEKDKEIERLNKELEEIKSKDVYEELLELRGRVFKAIDYIKFHFNDMVANVLIDILKGSDKE